MIVKILICSVTLICVSAQLMPVMPPETAGNQGTVSFSDLVAMMAMRNQLPVGDQQYTLLNLTGGKPIATVPPTQDWAVVPPQRPPMAPLTPTRPLTPVRPPSPMRPPTNMGPTAADAIKQALPGSVSAAVQAALPQAVQAAVQAALPTAVQTAVKAAGPVQPSQSLSPAVLQSAVRSAVDSAVKSALPTAVQTAVKAAKPMQGPPLISPAAMQTAVQAAVNSAIKTAMPSAVQTAVQSAVKSALPANIGSVIAASPNTTKPQTPKFVGPPPACSGTCPPKWVNTIRGFTGILKASSPMCEYRKLMTECQTPNSPCKSGYSCCPVSCLETIVACVQGPPIQFMCLPDDVTKWWPEMVQTYMKMTGMAGLIGGGRGGMMGGPMGGMMNAMMGGMGMGGMGMGF